MIGQIRRICVITLASIWCLTAISGLFLSVNAQQPNSNRLPILLIHGYNEHPNVWDSWRGWLRVDNFSKVYPIMFQDDKCGSVEEHAMELNNIVNRILINTGSEKVNIVAHSKGGLDARWYIAHYGIDKVANLIMIGTPNPGSPAAVWDISGCPPGSDSDLFLGSAATEVLDRPQITHYYAIAGNWMPDMMCWSGVLWFWVTDGGNCIIPGKDDSLVSVDSAESSPHYHYIPLGQPLPYDHFALLTHKDVYKRALPILER
jgi:pimeloyl-ACP methyl ester carboxylesterase